jgi:tetrahydromethanopterin S-methyltransferase subunit E
VVLEAFEWEFEVEGEVDLEADGQMIVALRSFVACVLVAYLLVVTDVVAEAVMAVLAVGIVAERVVAAEYFEAALRMDLVLGHRGNCTRLVLKVLIEAGLEE